MVLVVGLGLNIGMVASSSLDNGADNEQALSLEQHHWLDKIVNQWLNDGVVRVGTSGVDSRRVVDGKRSSKKTILSLLDRLS